jgi:hypothetical protein
MLIATFTEALEAYTIGAVILLVAGLGTWGLARLSRTDDIVVKVLCLLGSVVVGGAGVVVGGFIILLGIAVNGCPPDAYECPF